MPRKSMYANEEELRAARKAYRQKYYLDNKERIQKRRKELWETDEGFRERTRKRNGAWMSAYVKERSEIWHALFIWDTRFMLVDDKIELVIPSRCIASFLGIYGTTMEHWIAAGVFNFLKKDKSGNFWMLRRDFCSFVKEHGVYLKGIDGTKMRRGTLVKQYLEHMNEKAKARGAATGEEKVGDEPSGVSGAGEKKAP